LPRRHIHRRALGLAKVFGELPVVVAKFGEHIIRRDIQLERPARRSSISLKAMTRPGIASGAGTDSSVTTRSLVV
jgi:hypothetical protein